jgi:NAD(P)H-dependent FMN reductase
MKSRLFIPIILGSTRRERKSLRVARFILNRMQNIKQLETELIDLAEYDFPIMEERLRFREDPPPRLTEFSDKVSIADALLIVSPEYNHGYPGVLKNALDYLLPEYERKPFGIVTVSAGGLGGVNCLNQLRQVCLGMGAFPIPESFTVSHVEKSFDENGNPLNSNFELHFQDFIAELLWFAEAIAAQKKADQDQKSAA